MKEAMVQASMILPPHDTRDADKLSILIAGMIADGWVGRPVLVIDGVNDLHRALTGSHRVAAAQAADIAVPVLMIAQDELTEEIVEELDYANDDYDVERVLREYGLVNAADLMAAEIAANDAEL